MRRGLQNVWDGIRRNIYRDNDMVVWELSNGLWLSNEQKMICVRLDLQVFV